jgi:hypothetical protein
MEGSKNDMLGIKTTKKPTSRTRTVHVLVLIMLGFACILYVGLVAVPSINPDARTARVKNQFTTVTVTPGSATRPGLHFGSMTAPYDERTKTRYVYVRIGSRVWLYEHIVTSQP